MRQLEKQTLGNPHGVFLSGLLFLGALLAYNVLERLSPFFLRHLPSPLEEQLGSMIVSSAQGNHADDSPELQRALDKIFLSLQDSPLVRGQRLRLHILTSPQIAAYNFPAGEILVTSGLIVEARSSAEFAGVLAHEMAHLLLNHSRNELAESLRLSTLVGLLFLPADHPPASAALLVPDSLAIHYSEEEEQSANELAKALLHDAHLSHLPFEAFLRRIKRSENGLPPNLSYSAAHPLSLEPMTEGVIPEPFTDPEWELLRKLTGFLPHEEMNSYGAA